MLEENGKMIKLSDASACYVCESVGPKAVDGNDAEMCPSLVILIPMYDVKNIY